MERARLSTEKAPSVKAAISPANSKRDCDGTPALSRSSKSGLKGRSRMLSESIAREIAELLEEAAEAWQLASTLKDPASARDLLEYAAELESEVVHLTLDAGRETPANQKGLSGNPQANRGTRVPRPGRSAAA